MLAGQPMSPRLVRILLAAAATLVALEGGLQVLAWLRSRNAVDEAGGGAGGGPTILCVGDSLTYGLGAARDEAWPARMGAALAAEFPAVRVVNDALPGQTSVDVLERLAPRLDAVAPDVVCVLVGWNDTWSRPPPLDALPSSRSTFRWRFRTWRLLQLAFASGPAAVEDAAPEASGAPPPFLGAWHIGAVDFEFTADGRASFGGLGVTWSVTPDGIRMVHDDPAVPPYEIRVRRRVDGRLELQHPRWHRYMLARPGLAAARGPIEIAADLCDAELPELARATLREASDGPLRPAALAALLPLATGDAERAALVAELRQIWDGTDAPSEVGAALVSEAFRSGDHAAGLALGLDVLAREPGHVATWQTLTGHAGDDPAALAELTARLHRLAAAATSAAERAFAALLGARLASDAATCVRQLAAAIDAGVGVAETTAEITAAVGRGLTAEALTAAIDAAAIDAAACAPSTAIALRTALRRATADRGEVARALGRHLELAIDACRTRGIDVVLLGYPFGFDEHAAVVARIAAERRVARVETRASFDAMLRDAPREEWFVDPIHCTARGYAEMARLVTPVVAELLRRR